MIQRLALAAIILAIPAGSTSAPLGPQTAPAEPEILNNADPDSLQVYGLPPGTKPQWIKDPHAQFGKAMRVETPGGGNVWSVGVNSPLQLPVKKGDKLVIAFYARVAKPAEGAASAEIAAVQIQLAAAPYTRVFGNPVTIGADWKLYQAAGHADRDYAKGELAAALQINTAKQTLDIGALAVLNYGQKP